MFNILVCMPFLASLFCCCCYCRPLGRMVGSCGRRDPSACSRTRRPSSYGSRGRRSCCHRRVVALVAQRESVSPGVATRRGCFPGRRSRQDSTQGGGFALARSRPATVEAKGRYDYSGLSMLRARLEDGFRMPLGSSMQVDRRRVLFGSRCLQ